MRQMGIWFWLSIKRWLLHPGFAALLILIPVLMAGIRSLEPEKTEKITIGVWAEGDGLGQETAQELSTRDGMFQFVLYASEDEAIEAVETREAECAYLFPADLQERLAGGDYRRCIAVCTAPLTILEPLTGEIVFAALASRYDGVLLEEYAEQEEAFGELDETGREQLRELYRPQWEQAKTIAQQHAYQDVMNEYRPALENCIQEMNQHLARLDEVHDRFIERFGAELKYLAVDIAEKWILQRIPANDDLLEQMVMQAVNTVKDCKWMDVQLSEQMVGLSEKIQKQLASPEYGGRARVSLHKTDSGSCVIQTEAGELDVSVSTQAQQLKKLFRENT